MCQITHMAVAMWYGQAHHGFIDTVVEAALLGLLEMHLKCIQKPQKQALTVFMCRPKQMSGFAACDALVLLLL
jgi:hypothetical protein